MFSYELTRRRFGNCHVQRERAGRVKGALAAKRTLESPGALPQNQMPERRTREEILPDFPDFEPDDISAVLACAARETDHRDGHHGVS